MFISGWRANFFSFGPCRTCYMAAFRWKLWPTNGTRKFGRDRRALRMMTMKQNFCDIDILFTKSLVMSPVKVESFILSGGATRRPRRILKFIKPDTWLFFFLFFNLYCCYSLVCGTCFLLHFGNLNCGKKWNVNQQWFIRPSHLTRQAQQTFKL